MKLPNFLTTVTPTSKLLALILFILLPFVGFYMGMKYQKLLTPTLPTNYEECIQSPNSTVLGRTCITPDGFEFTKPGLNQLLVSLSPVPDETANWKKYRNDEFGFEFKYPADWPDAQEKLNSTYSAPSNKEISFGDLLTIYAKDNRYSSPSTLDEYIPQLSLAANTTIKDVSNENFFAFQVTQLNGDTKVDISNSLRSVKIISLRFNALSAASQSIYSKILSTFKFIARCKECLPWSPPPPGWCDNGTVKQRSLIYNEEQDCYCHGPSICEKSIE